MPQGSGTDDFPLFSGMMMVSNCGLQFQTSPAKDRLRMLRSKSADFITNLMSSLKCSAVPSSVMDPEHI